MVEMLDVDSDGLVDLKEFIKAMARKSEVQSRTVQLSMERLGGEEEDNPMLDTVAKIQLGAADIDFDIEVECVAKKLYLSWEKTTGGIVF